MKIYWAWLVALLATLTSIYFGEVLQIDPCKLCWYQRMAMFPLVWFLAVSFYKRDQKLAVLSLPLVFIGALLALVQLLMPSVCDAHCTLTGLTPIVSLASFLAIGILILKNKF